MISSLPPNAAMILRNVAICMSGWRSNRERLEGLIPFYGNLPCVMSSDSRNSRRIISRRQFLIAWGGLLLHAARQTIK